MLIDMESLVTGFRLLPLSLAGLSLPLLAEVPTRVSDMLDPPARPATLAPPPSPLLSLLVVVVIVGLTQLIPWHYWRKYARIRGGHSGYQPDHPHQWRAPEDVTTTNPSAADDAPREDGYLFDRRLSLRTEVGLALVAYVLPALLLCLALVLGSP